MAYAWFCPFMGTYVVYGVCVIYDVCVVYAIYGIRFR